MIKMKAATNKITRVFGVYWIAPAGCISVKGMTKSALSQFSANISAGISLAPRELIPLGQMPPFIIDATMGLKTRFKQDLADHFRNHDHPNIFAQAFMNAESKIKIVVPVASRYKFVRILEGPRVEHRRLSYGQNCGFSGNWRLVVRAFANRVID